MFGFDNFFRILSQRYFQAWKMQAIELIYSKEILKKMCVFRSLQKSNNVGED